MTDSTMQWGIYLIGAGRTLNPVTEDYPFEKQPAMYHIDWESGRTLPEFEAILITDGQGVFESVQTGTADIDAGTLIFLFPGVWHRYRSSRAKGWAERWISFNGDISYRLMNQGLVTPQSAVLPAKNVRKLTREFLPITSISCLAGFSSEDRMRAAFEELEGMPPTAYRQRHGRLDD